MLMAAITREIPKKRAREEDSLQMAIVEYMRFTDLPGVVFHSVPNEAKRSPRLGAHMKRMGLLPGAGDLLILTPPNARAHYMELKRNSKDARQSKEQIDFQSAVTACGGDYVVVRSLDEAIPTLRKWGAVR